MRIFFYCSIIALFLSSCASAKIGSRKDPLSAILKSAQQRDTLMAKVLNDPDYEVQIIYTQIDRDANGKPSFKSYNYQADSTHYFYPASTVKMPLALLSLERINHLRRSGYPRFNKDTPYRLDSLRAFQQKYSIDSTAPQNKPSIAQDIRQIFVVSDNEAYNHMFEFLGREYINKTLESKGYLNTGIMHRFNYARRENQYTSPISFYEPTYGIWKQGELTDAQKWVNPMKNTLKGNGYYVGDSIVRKPFEMGKKNWFALNDMQKMLQSVIFPESVPESQRFMLSKEDYRFLWHYMGIFPRECDYPKYDTVSHYDGYCKFFLFGDEKKRQNGNVRVFNKVGEAYGTLTDIAYIVDFDNQVEFMLTATILCNKDGIFNDDQYDYDNIGFPFLAKLGREVYQYELKRGRKYKPDLSGFKAAVN